MNNDGVVEKGDIVRSTSSTATATTTTDIAVPVGHTTTSLLNDCTGCKARLAIKVVVRVGLVVKIPTGPILKPSSSQEGAML